MKLRTALLFILILSLVSVIQAQDSTPEPAAPAESAATAEAATPEPAAPPAAPTVPDLAGLTIPQAAAALNRVGLRLGQETISTWTAESGLPENSVSAQSVPAGSPVARGEQVNVTVLRTTNATLIYDGNDFTLINRAPRRLDLRGISFNALQTTTQASFGAARWANRLRGSECAQVWSVGRTTPKDIPGCGSISNWLTTNNTAEHFWTGANGVTTFNVVQDGVERGICNAAPANSENAPVTCEVYLATGGRGDSTEYLYFAYTTDKLIIRNNAPDGWMRVDATTIITTNPVLSRLGASFILGNPEVFGNPQNIVGRIDQLAPAQCLFFKAAGVEIEPKPEECDIVAATEFMPEVLFWTADFQVQSAQSEQRRTCRAATPDRLTICIMPR